MRGLAAKGDSQSLRGEDELEDTVPDFVFFQVCCQAVNLIAEVHDEIATVVLLPNRDRGRGGQQADISRFSSSQPSRKVQECCVSCFQHVPQFRRLLHQSMM